MNLKQLKWAAYTLVAIIILIGIALMLLSLRAI